MNTAIEQMLRPYVIKNIHDQKNAMKEIIQEIVLCGLSRAEFFRDAAFYGGTALRIFHGLERFSEDLDFSLKVPNPTFSLEKYFPVLEKEIRAFGLNLRIEERRKTTQSHIRSAFLKGNTREHLLLFCEANPFKKSVAKNEALKIKFEVDVDPPPYATFEHKYRLLPIPYSIQIYDMPSLLAGKIHAVLCRAWKHRVKGRDLYDYIFYRSRNVPVNVQHLKARLLQTRYIEPDALCDIASIRRLLCARFDTIDFKQAREDVEPFIKDTSVLHLWCADFFKQITENLSACD